jgi:hypothetical protein
MSKKSLIYAVIVLLTGCIERFEIVGAPSKPMLVVEGVLSNELKRHQIILSRTTNVTNRRVAHESGALVRITNKDQEEILLTEKKPGVYETPLFAAEAEQEYTLHIRTSNGREYSSGAVPFTDGPDIGNVYPKYISHPQGAGKGVQVYVDTEDESNQGHYYRWHYTETYQVQTPFPSNYIWLGGNDLEFRLPGIDICYVSDTMRHILLRKTIGQEEDKISGLEIRYIDENEYLLRTRYSILVQQFIMSEQAYHYWNELRLSSEQQGTLSDRQPGSLRGNVGSITDPSERVLGLFEVCKVSEKRIFFSAIDFYYDGLKMPLPLRESCFNYTPVIFMENELATQMPKYESTMYVWDVSGLSPNVSVYLLPKSCCDCRDKGPTERPDFF